VDRPPFGSANIVAGNGGENGKADKSRDKWESTN